MSDSPPVRPARPLPGWLVALGSVVIVGHLAAVVILVLAAPSGPWPSPMGPNMAQPPAFAQLINGYSTMGYLRPLKMTHTYHFASNRPAVPGVFFEVNLKDDKGEVVKTVKFPEEGANFWVRHRQLQLAQRLADDQPVEAPQGDKIPAPNQKVPTVDIWEGVGEMKLAIRSTPEHLVPRDRPVMRPSAWSVMLAHAYVRHLCRKYGAASGELIRHTREALPPNLLTTDELPSAAFAELISNFGEMKR
jgi:hypothetical protein